MWKDDFIAELLTWKGTPHRHLQCVKGEAADCGMFILDALVQTGASRRYIVNKHSRLWYYFTDKEVILDIINEVRKSYMQTGFNMVRVNDITDIASGDILTFALVDNVEKSNHIAVVINDTEVIHSVKKFGVIISPLKDYEKRISNIFRVIK
jgi:hypothetical protein